MPSFELFALTLTAGADPLAAVCDAPEVAVVLVPAPYPRYPPEEVLVVADEADAALVLVFPLLLLLLPQPLAASASAAAINAAGLVMPIVVMTR
jgi:hypothetical protein